MQYFLDILVYRTLFLGDLITVVDLLLEISVLEGFLRSDPGSRTHIQHPHQQLLF
jgi:hypothetical protein